MDSCGPMRIESFDGKKYVLVIVDDYSRYTWTRFLRSKDETPEVLIDFLRMIQRGFHAQNYIVERRNRTLVEAARTMLSVAKLPLFFWAEAIGTAYGENLDKMKEKGDACIFMGYSTQSKDHDSSDPAPQCHTMALEHNTLSPDPHSQYNVPTTDETYSAVTTADASDKHQQLNTTPSTSTTLAADITQLDIQTTPEPTT
ncbi:retrovirus-related pol polyprotein from transposon TNT 1-94 [Tanacetum coccineum]